MGASLIIHKAEIESGRMMPVLGLHHGLVYAIVRLVYQISILTTSQWHWSTYSRFRGPRKFANTIYIAQYNAWCLNDGIHQTPKRSFVNWNAELVWRMRSELEYQWDLVEDDIPIIFGDLIQATKAPLEFLESIVQGWSPLHPWIIDQQLTSFSA